ncbi:MAG: MBL fold metallo-hydrolase [Clostridia bacterium]|nr:MBL fold metallo-hydrolase [Clostridia bacterium]
MIELTWLGQMGLLIRTPHTTLCIDYYADPAPRRLVPVPIVREEMRHVDFILGTHDHTDHIDRPSWKVWAKTMPKAQFVAPRPHFSSLVQDGIPADRLIPVDAGETYTFGDITLHPLPAAHEFLSPDEEGHYPCLQYVLSGGGIRIYHAGDTLRYEGMLPKLLALGPFDVALLPINGRDGRRYRSNCIGNMTFQEAADLAGALEPRLTLPGHWDMFEGNTADPEAFIDYMDAKYPHLTCRLPEVGVPFQVESV